MPAARHFFCNSEGRAEKSFSCHYSDLSEGARPFRPNSWEVVEYAHARNVSVEAGLGKIGCTDHLETDEDSELYTDPEKAKKFFEPTQVDALAVPVGTACGVYAVKASAIQFERIRKIYSQISSYLVLHGSSSVPVTDVVRAHQNGCGISKVKVATDLELVFLCAVKMERMTNQQCDAQEEDLRRKGLVT